MSRYEPVPLPTGAAYAPYPEVVAGLRRWATARPTRDLVTAFGGTLPDLDTGGLLAWLDRFSGEHWDYRARGGGVERDEVSGPDFPEPIVETVREAAGALGLAEPQPQPQPPPGGGYQHLLVLGGLARSCLDRTGYAAHLLTGAVAAGASAVAGGGAAANGGTVEVAEIAALGSFRPLRAAETDDAGTGPLNGCRYEVDVMDLGIRSAFGFAEPDEIRSSTGEINHHSWAVRTYRSPAGPVVRVLAAPSTEPATRRAHTTDTYHFWAGQVRLTPEDRVLIVTCPIYVPFQHCDAIRTLGLTYGCAVETVGVDPAGLAASGRPARSWTTDRYLQEIRSAIRSMRKLHDALPPR